MTLLRRYGHVLLLLVTLLLPGCISLDGSPWYDPLRDSRLGWIEQQRERQETHAYERWLRARTRQTGPALPRRCVSRFKYPFLPAC